MSGDSFKERLDTVFREYHSTQYGNERTSIVRDNMDLLRDANLLETIFLDVWSQGTNGVDLIAAMDPGKLLKSGDPLPDDEVFTVYRGVAGVGGERRIRGYSWSGSFEIALGFAITRGKAGLPNPAVYRATIARQHVIAYIHAVYLEQSGWRHEEEFIVRPARLSRPVEICCPTKHVLKVLE